MVRAEPRGRLEAALRECVAAALLGAPPSGGGGFVVAYSAGPDSTALLAAAAALALPGLAAAYVDHGIRPAAEREAELALARRFSARLGLPLSIARIRPGAVEALARGEGLGIEAAARLFRYRALREILSRRRASWVLMAHNRDDQVETALMRFLGGSGAGGLRGIPRANGAFLRPFLGLPKSELLAYVEELGLEYSTDSTNAEGDYARNRLRLELAPVLDRAFPGWRRGVLLASEKAAGEDDALASAAASLAFAPTGARKEAEAAEAALLLAAPRAAAERALVEAAGRLLGRGRVSGRLARAALAALAAGASYRGGGLDFHIAGKLAIVSRTLDFPGRGGYFVQIGGPCRVRAGSLAVSAEWSGAEDRGSPPRGIRACAFSFPLAIRSRRPGDEIALPGGTKRVDVLLSEMGMPPESRDRVPVVEDRDGIVALLGACFGARDRYRRGPAAEDERFLAIIVKGA